MRLRRVYQSPRLPDAERVCSLDRETALRRQEPPDRFLDAALSREQIDGGGIFHFERRPDTWQRVRTFMEEEALCCPFFAFEAWEDEGEVVLRIEAPGNRDG